MRFGNLSFQINFYRKDFDINDRQIHLLIFSISSFFSIPSLFSSLLFGNSLNQFANKRKTNFCGFCKSFFCLIFCDKTSSSKISPTGSAKNSTGKTSTSNSSAWCAKRSSSFSLEKIITVQHWVVSVMNWCIHFMCL